MTSPSRTIVIVGAGLSGTLVAANLLRSQHWQATRLVLIERSSRLARGKAYAEREHPYLLNVPAGRMSVDPRSPLDFLSFAQRRIPAATAEDFLPRALYGEYLEATLLEAELSAPAHVQFERVRGEVCAIERLSQRRMTLHAPADGRSPAIPATASHGVGGTSSFRLELVDGRQFVADDVVLALGNPPPASIPGTESLLEGSCNDSSRRNGTQARSDESRPAPRYVSDPWAGPLTFRAGESVLLIGAGLTMVDAALAATTASNEQVVIHSISRHGLIPSSQTPFAHTACNGDRAAMLRAASFSALTLLRSVRELADETERSGGDWRETITFIRNIAPELWKRLPVRERKRILRHVRPYWDVHRHRLPSETLAKLKHLRQRQKLHVHAGRVLKFESVGHRIRVTWRPRGARQTQTLLVDRIVNCTGPDHDVNHSSDPLMRSLVSQGLAVADPLALGLRTGPYGALIDSRGRPAANLFYVGPLLRADYWEATAAHELRGHAERLASYLAAPLGRLRAAQSA